MVVILVSIELCRSLLKMCFPISNFSALALKPKQCKKYITVVCSLIFYRYKYQTLISVVGVQLAVKRLLKVVFGMKTS